MKILYLDLGMGAAGDMLAGALLGLLDEKARAETLETLNAALPAGVAATCERAAQHGLAGWKFTVTVDGAEETPHPSPAAEETDCHGPSGLAMTGRGAFTGPPLPGYTGPRLAGAPLAGRVRKALPRGSRSEDRGPRRSRSTAVRTASGNLS